MPSTWLEARGWLCLSPAALCTLPALTELPVSAAHLSQQSPGLITCMPAPSPGACICSSSNTQSTFPISHEQAVSQDSHLQEQRQMCLEHRVKLSHVVALNLEGK